VKATEFKAAEHEVRARIKDMPSCQTIGLPSFLEGEGICLTC
jgi:hypothetical protein